MSDKLPDLRVYQMPVHQRCEHRGCQRRAKMVIILVHVSQMKLHMAYVCRGHLDAHSELVHEELERLGYESQGGVH